MTDTEIIIEVAKLDGWIPNTISDTTKHWLRGNSEWCQNLPNYLTSRDAIVSVIERQSFTVQGDIARCILAQGKSCGGFNQICLVGILATPYQLCIALLKATGKYHE